ncbi:MAG: hypothetical protein ACD_79C00844G0001 [uncultured bacterium]|nr:MAG: hypothetical protein ACD_79C00844G0001 [uncultured bacterium]
MLSTTVQFAVLSDNTILEPLHSAKILLLTKILSTESIPELHLIKILFEITEYGHETIAVAVIL